MIYDVRYYVDERWTGAWAVADAISPTRVEGSRVVFVLCARVPARLYVYLFRIGVLLIFEWARYVCIYSFACAPRMFYNANSWQCSRGKCTHMRAIFSRTRARVLRTEDDEMLTEGEWETLEVSLGLSYISMYKKNKIQTQKHEKYTRANCGFDVRSYIQSSPAKRLEADIACV